VKQLIDLIGNTPLVEIKSPRPEVKIYGKLEGNNPGGSVKDRAALNMIVSAMERGEIREGSQLIEATSGNTGIALAMLASQYRLPIELVMPANSTRERVVTMEAFGAKVTLLDSIEACRDYADEKGKEQGFFQFNQFANPDNYLAHFKTTGPEIWRDTDGKISHFVASMGTTGTIMGTSMFLKDKNKDIEIVGCQPTENSSIPGIRRWPVEYLPKIYDPARVDRVVDVAQTEAEEKAVALAREEGVFVGVSSGGQAHVAVELAKTLASGLIVFICCDRGDRYLSSGIFGQ
jgi:cysteine synthase B